MLKRQRKKNYDHSESKERGIVSYTYGSRILKFISEELTLPNLARLLDIIIST